MNNKGFAITGILYTLFILFLSVLLSILATISYKKQILEKTVMGLEDEFALEKVVNVADSYQEDGGSVKALINGKYVFKTIMNNGSNPDKICSIYMKKGEEIPTVVDNSVYPNFILVPHDCNKHPYNISLDGVPTKKTLALVEVYEFKEWD